MNAGGGSDRPLVVLGPGAVGGLLAAMLCRAGTDVIVSGRSSTLAAIDHDGLVVRSQALGTWTSRPVTTAELPRGADIILAVKSFALPSVIQRLATAQPASVLSVLNGIDHLATLRNAVPQTQVIPAAIIVEAARAPTGIEHRSAFVRLNVPDSALAVPPVSSLRRAGVEVCPGGGEVEVLWRKFRFLAPMALLTALHGEPLGEALMRDPGLAASVLTEVAAAATAAGLATTAADLVEILHGLPRTMRSSLQLDVSAGGETELEALGGALLDFASGVGVAAPTCAQIVEVLRGRVAAEPVGGANR